MTTTPIEAGARADLLPCPFCGEQKIFFNPPDKARGWKGSINCPACLVTMPREASDDELIRCWNTRAGSPATAVAEMRERCAKVAELAGCGNQKCMACYGNQIAAMIRDLSPAGGDYVVVRKSDLTELTRICNGAEHDAKYAARRLSGGEQQRFLTDKQRELLRPLADAISEAVCKIHGLNDVELNDLAQAAYAASETNCGWHIFAAAKIILPETRLERGQRDRAALSSSNNGEG